MIIKTGIVPKMYGRLYSELFDVRQEGDYLDFFEVNPKTLEEWMPLVERFIQTIRALLGESRD